MTELSFLLDLLLNHKLPKATREAVTARVKEVEEKLLRQPQSVQVLNTPAYQHNPVTSAPIAYSGQLLGVPQAASTLANFAKHGGDGAVIVPALPPGPGFEPPAAAQPAVVAQTPAAMQAMASRQQAIRESLAGKVDKTTGRPRKF